MSIYNIILSILAVIVVALVLLIIGGVVRHIESSTDDKFPSLKWPSKEDDWFTIIVGCVLGLLSLPGLVVEAMKRNK